MRRKIFGIFFLVTLVAFGFIQISKATDASSLSVVPAVFDFGWSPDNAKVTAEFTVKNTGPELISLTALTPSCGCTAPQFTPADLNASDIKKIGLTFDTRGYTGVRFHKNAKLKAGTPETTYDVGLAGVVADPKELFIPVGTGIAAFDPETKTDKQIIEIQNKTPNEISFDIVQSPADWAVVKLESKKIEPGKTTKAEISVKGSLKEDRHTSITFEGVEASTQTVHRLTLAIRTGESPKPYRKLPAPAPVPAVSSQPAKLDVPKPGEKK